MSQQPYGVVFGIVGSVDSALLYSCFTAVETEARTSRVNLPEATLFVSDEVGTHTLGLTPELTTP